MIKQDNISDILKVLQKIEAYYKDGYFVYEFDKLLGDEKPSDLILIEKNDWQIYKSFMINTLYEPSEALKDGKIYLETIFYLFGLWAYKYLTGEDYALDLNRVKYPGIFQFFQNIMVDDFRERISDFDELKLYLHIALDELIYKSYRSDNFGDFNIEGITSVGMIRYENQDSFDFVKKDNCLLAVVADGMGGGSFGDVASRIAVNTMINSIDQIATAEKEKIDGVLKEITMTINQRILHYKKSNKVSSMGTTMSAIIIKDSELFFCHVGDSRIYIKFKQNHLYEQITLDHSVSEVEFRKGNITKEQKEEYAKNILAFVLGSEKLKIEDINITSDYAEKITEDSIDSIVLCSDGCWDLIEPEQFNKDVKSILEIANSFVTHDNTTIIKIERKYIQENFSEKNLEIKSQGDITKEPFDLEQNQIQEHKQEEFGKESKKEDNIFSQKGMFTIAGVLLVTLLIAVAGLLIESNLNKKQDIKEPFSKKAEKLQVYEPQTDKSAKELKSDLKQKEQNKTKSQQKLYNSKIQASEVHKVESINATKKGVSSLQVNLQEVKMQSESDKYEKEVEQTINRDINNTSN
jgi:protein phosphatase